MMFVELKPCLDEIDRRVKEIAAVTQVPEHLVCPPPRPDPNAQWHDPIALAYWGNPRSDAT